MTASQPSGVTPPKWVSTAGQRRRRQIAGGAVSAAIHLGAAFFLFSSASGGLISAAAGGGGAEGPIFSVEMVRAADFGAAPSTPAAELEPLFAKYHVAAAENAIPLQASEAPSRLTALAQRLTAFAPPSSSAEQKPSKTALAASGSPHPAARPLLDRAAAADQSQTPAQGDARSTTSTGALWGKIQPCWLNIRGRNNVAVSLEVKLDSRGRLDGPPKILRATSATIDEPRLKAEAAAVAAVAACLPRNDIRFGGQVHRLDFQN